MTPSEKLHFTVTETVKHINNVRRYADKLMIALNNQIQSHDKSKLQDPEKDLFVEHTYAIAQLSYGSEEYFENLKNLKPALDHHYSVSRHHPEHFENGIDGMTLVDLMELIADWKAATLRHEDGDIMRSLEFNAKRYNISPQLLSILKNTVEKYLKD